MSWEKPAPSAVWQAIDIYLKQAYGVAPPSAVRARLDTLRSTPAAEFYEAPVIEHDKVPAPPRFALRLGNRFYPHMKLIIDRAPDGRGYLFRADTHDSHCQPPAGSRESRAFAELMQANRSIAESIEAAWDQDRLPTFKQFLREDLARRKAVQA